jgi:L-threonylcarbamoyladenylate synthase
MRIIDSAKRAAELINQGEVVAFPTETVYGLGANALNLRACQQIYSLKGRSKINPLIVHVPTINKATEVGVFSSIAMLLARQFWPGPLTLVVELNPNASIASNVTAGLETVALRVPNHEIAQELLHLADVPIAAPSANISNYVTATLPKHVKDDFHGQDLNILISGENTQSFGLESTIIDTTSAEPTILRQGAILAEEIEAALGYALALPKSYAVKAPGMLSKHYSPRTKIRLNANEVDADEVGIDFGSQLSCSFSLSREGDLYRAANNLYAILRQADKYAIEHGLQKIAIATIPSVGIGVAINDKLERASK